MGGRGGERGPADRSDDRQGGGHQLAKLRRVPRASAKAQSILVSVHREPADSAAAILAAHPVQSTSNTRYFLPIDHNRIAPPFQPFRTGAATAQPQHVGASRLGGL